MPLKGSNIITRWVTRCWKPILLLIFFVWPGWGTAAVPTPSIQIPIPDFYFGMTEEGTILSHDFLVKNTGSGVLEIRDVRPG
jgi:hypothetical protein